MQRWRSLDDLRGLTILVMIPVNALMDFALVPAWAKHAPQAGMNIADFVLPAFLFAMGISASFSLRRRLSERGWLRTMFHGLVRYGLLFAFGTIGYFAVWQQANWEVLQLLGLAGALAFLFMFLPPFPRLLAAIALLAGVELFRPLFFAAQFQAWYASGIGGPWGFLPFAALPLAASALGEWLREADTSQRVRRSLAAGALVLMTGLAWWLLAGGPDKHLVTTAYLLIAGGVAALVLGLLSSLEAHVSMPILTALGRNSLLMYMLSGVLILPIRAWVPADSPLGMACLWAGAVLVASLAVAWILDRRSWYLRL